jgi:hypothetical protein
MGSVRLISPEGEAYDIPDSDVESAKAQGFKEPGASAATRRLLSPEGEAYEIPETDVSKALEQGFTDPTSAPRAAPEPMPSMDSPSDGWIQMVKDDGSSVEVSPASLDAAKASGYRLASDVAKEQAAQAQAAADEAEYGDKTGIVQTAGEGIARGFSLGFDTPMALAQSGVEYLGNKTFEALNPGRPSVGFDETYGKNVEAIKKRQEVNRGTAIASEIYGTIVPAIATGGTSLGARAAALAPTAAVSRLGVAAGARTAAALGAGTVSGKVAGLLAGAAVEGAMWGAAQQVNQAYLEGDYDGVAQHALAGAALGAGIGAAAAGVFGTVAKLGRMIGGMRVRSEAQTLADDLQKIREGTPELKPNTDLTPEVPTVPDRPPVTETPMMQPIQGEEATAGKAFARGAKAKAAFKQAQQEATTTIVDLGSENAKLWDEALDWANVHMKPKAALKALAEGPPPDPEAAKMAVLNQFMELRNNVIQLSAEAETTNMFRAGGARQLKKILQFMDKEEATIFNGLSEDGMKGLANGLISMDRTKRFVQRAAAAAKAGIDGDVTAQKAIRDISEGPRAFLEDSNILGEGWSSLQTNTNKAWTAYIPFADANESRFVLHENLQTRKSTRDLYAMLPDYSDEKVGAFLKNINSAEARQGESVLVNTPRLQADLIEQLGKYYDVSGNHGEVVQQIRKNADRIADQVKRLKDIQNVANKYESITEKLDGVPLAKAIFGAASTAVDTVESHTTLGSASTAAKVIDGAATGFSKAMTGTQKAASRIGKAANAAQLLRPTLTYEAVKSILSDAKKVTTPGTAEHRQMIYYVQNVEEQAGPEVAQAVAAHVMASAQFLASKMPGGGAQDIWGADTQLDPLTQKKLANYAEVASNPMRAIERLGQNAATPEDLETLKAVWPSLYNNFRKLAVKKLADSENRPSYAQRVRLSMLLGVPLDSSMDPKSFALTSAAQAWGKTPDGQQAQGLAPKPSMGKIKSPGQSMESKADSLSLMSG